MKKRDAGRGLVAFVHIADNNYTPEEHTGIGFEAAMGRIHAVLPDDVLIKNMEVFRRVYEILGMGWIYAATRWPIIGPIVDILYGILADWRLTLMGRNRDGEVGVVGKVGREESGGKWGSRGRWGSNSPIYPYSSVIF